MLKVVPVKKSSASDQVFEQLKDNLIQGTWKPGEKLASENELASLFGVSRITIRQALSRLAALGLVETRLGEGSFVAEPKPGMYMQSIIPAVFLGSSISDDFERELLEFRVVNEVATAKLAVDHATDEDLEKLTYLRNEMVRAAERNDIARYTGADFQFHEAISAMTHNSIVMAVHSILSDALQPQHPFLTSVVGWRTACAATSGCWRRSWPETQRRHKPPCRSIWAFCWRTSGSAGRKRRKTGERRFFANPVIQANK